MVTTVETRLCEINCSVHSKIGTIIACTVRNRWQKLNWKYFRTSCGFSTEMVDIFDQFMAFSNKIVDRFANCRLFI